LALPKAGEEKRLVDGKKKLITETQVVRKNPILQK
jgi:hypothetical protein